MSQLKAPVGARKKKKIVGRGGGSGKGRTAGRGHDGQNSRSGGGVRVGFEGGQMPLYRRIARKGFSNSRFKRNYQPVSLSMISSYFNDGDTVSLESLKEKRVVKGKHVLVKILADGEIDKKLIVQGLAASAKAVEKIQEAGGEIK
ncbi:MAG: 50S ribosomal protein L15 [Spirochaetia bacterium]|nr:50S ribosomal protein L15 [Spirochaetia bacterium]MCF7953246.1 50S ribosomal protein L15 [Spirochaetales bacterium]